MSIAAVAIAIAVVVIAGGAWIWFEAWRVTRPEYDDYNARQDAADRWHAPDAGSASPRPAETSPSHGVDDRPDTLPA